MPSPLQDKSKAFALEIIKVCNEVKRSKRESILTDQLIRSGTSIGANIREAMYAHGKADFIAKLQIALKECSESEYCENMAARCWAINISPVPPWCRASWCWRSIRPKASRRGAARYSAITTGRRTTMS